MQRSVPRVRSSGLAYLAFCLVSSTIFGWAAANDPIGIGDRRELFVDRLLIQDLKGAELELQRPVKATRAKSPLPERHMMTVIKDGDLYRAWYRGIDPKYTGPSHSGSPGETLFYAESKDGIEWEFPLLRLQEYHGSLENNVVMANYPPYLTDFMPFLDTRPGVDPSERYKAVAGYPGPGDKRGISKPGMGLFGFVSPDGLKWTKKEEIIPYRPEWRHAMDSPNVAFWSEAEQKYVCYFRTWTPEDRLRTVSRSTSPDFVNWSEPVAMNPNLPGEHLYTTMTHPYVRAPHIYLAFPTRFVPKAKDSADTVQDNVTDLLFMTSRAGSDHYDRTFTEAYIKPGLDPKRWLNRANYVAENVVQTGPAELTIYHRSGDRYILRPDGFISVHAGAEEGTLLTKPLIFKGRSLELNYSASAVGFVRVEILDMQGKVLATSKNLTGDFIDETVGWENDAKIEAFAGKPVQLRFTLKEVDLYSMRFFE